MKKEDKPQSGIIPKLVFTDGRIWIGRPNAKKPPTKKPPAKA